MKRTLFVVTGILICTQLFAFEPEATKKLLAGYLSKNTELMNIGIETRKTYLSYESTQLDNGFDIHLSTGNMTLVFDSTNGNSFSVRPSVNAELPQYAGLDVNLSGDVEVGTNEGKTKTSLSNLSLNVSADIISSAGQNRTITLLKAERSCLEAKRKLQRKSLEVEKQFYTELKSIINSVSAVMSLEHELYEDQISLEKVRAQGYSENSVTYRRANMEVYNDNHEMQTKRRALYHDLVVFYQKCGYKIESFENTELLQFIPNDIQEVALLNIKDFSPENYTEIESAEWNHKINGMQRDAKKNYSLSANGGYTFNNSSVSKGSGKASSNTVDVGLSGSIGGVNLGLGTSIPVTGESRTPAITMSASVSPNTFRKNEISKEQDVLDEQKEKLALVNARISFGTFAVDTRKQAEDLEWEKQSINESLEMYIQQEKDLLNWYNAGVITKSEYLSAKNSRQSYDVKKISNLIDRIIFNDSLSLNFVDVE